MVYRITGGSCLDLTEDMKKDPRFQMIPLTLQVGSAQVVDDETFNQKRFVEMVKACPECPKTACPSPETFKTTFERAGAEAVFTITLPSHFSGGYNSAVVARRLCEKEMAEKGMAEQTKKVAVTDSLSVSSGELDITLSTQDLYDSGLESDEVVGKTLAYRDSMSAYFVLESLDTLHKNGRLLGLQAFFATAPNIKPAMGADTGTIIKLDQARGMNKASQRMYDIAVKEVADVTSRIAVICRVNNPEQAEYVRDRLAKRVGFEKIVVTNAAGMTTVYASDGGIVLAV